MVAASGSVVACGKRKQGQEGGIMQGTWILLSDGHIRYIDREDGFANVRVSQTTKLYTCNVCS